MEAVSLNKSSSAPLKSNSASPSSHISSGTLKILSSLLFCSGSIFAAYMHAQTVNLTGRHDVLYQSMCAIPPLLGAAVGALFIYSMPAKVLEVTKSREESLRNIAWYRDTANVIGLSVIAYAAPKYAWLPGILLGYVAGGQMTQIWQDQSSKRVTTQPPLASWTSEKSNVQ